MWHPVTGLAASRPASTMPLVSCRKTSAWWVQAVGPLVAIKPWGLAAFPMDRTSMSCSGSVAAEGTEAKTMAAGVAEVTEVAGNAAGRVMMGKTAVTVGATRRRGRPPPDIPVGGEWDGPGHGLALPAEVMIWAGAVSAVTQVRLGTGLVPSRSR